MTLDEAIAIAKKVSEDESADARGRKDYRQIAEWLEELKQYKEENQHEKIVIEKEKPAKRELKLFSVEVVLTPDTEDNMQLESHIKGSRAEITAFLEKMDVKPDEYRSILKHAVKAMLRDFVQQVVNLSESLEGAEMEEMED